MNNYHFAIEVLKDLENQMHQPSGYKAVKCAGLIRQLLFDKNQVLALAQRESGKLFRFYVDTHGIEGDPTKFHPNYVLHFLSNMDMEGGLIAKTIDEYIGMKVMYAGKQLFTIKDIIKYLANKRGGVHLDEGNLDEDQKIMDSISREIELNGFELLIQESYNIAENMVNSAYKSHYLSRDGAA